MKKICTLLILLFACKLMAQDPRFCREMLQKARVNLAAKKWHSAREYCEAALPLCPGMSQTIAGLLDSISAGIEAEKAAFARSTRAAELTSKMTDLMAQPNYDRTLLLRLTHEACRVTQGESPLYVKNRINLLNDPANTFATSVFTGHASEVLSVAFSPDGQRILTGSNDKLAKLWDLTGRELQSFVGHREGVESVAFSPDGKFVLTGSLDKTAKLWDLNGLEIQAFAGHGDAVESVAFSPDGQFILTGSLDKTAKLWDLSGREIQVFNGHKDAVQSVAFSPNGQAILTGSEDGTAKLWDLNGRERQTFAGHTAAVWSVVFFPDGQSVLTGSLDRTAKLWDLKGNEIRTFFGHDASVWPISVSPGGK